MNTSPISDRHIIIVHQVNLFLHFMDVQILMKKSAVITISIEFGMIMKSLCILQDCLPEVDVDGVMDEILVINSEILRYLTNL